MFTKTIIRSAAVAITLLGAMGANVASAEKVTLQIGGVGNVFFIDSTSLVGNANGTFGALSSTIHSFVVNGDGTADATLTHNFVTANNGFIITDDTMHLVEVAGRPNVYAFQVNYTVVRSGHGLEGCEGQHFKSQGLVDLPNSVAEVRYEGKIECNAPSAKAGK